MRHGGTGPRRLGCLTALSLLCLISVPHAPAGELERMYESYAGKLKAYEKRIAEIEAKGRGVSADPGKRADGITRDRVAEIRAALKGGGGPGRGLAELAEKASGDGKALADVYRGQNERFDIATGEWGPDGAERRKLREALTALQKSLELVSTNLAMAAEAAEAMNLHAERSGVLEKVARLEAVASEARERLSARWERERAAREREREQREREAAERARGVR